MPSRADVLRLKRIGKASAMALATLAEHKDPYAAQHILRVSRLSDDIARALSHAGHHTDVIDERFRELLRVGSMLHDVGKVTIPDGILLKPGPLTPEERAAMQRHSHNGRLILQRAVRLSGEGGYLVMGAEIAGLHHERFDGGGYPEGLSGTDIPLSARIVAVADVFDALTHRRAYKDAWTQEAAIAFIQERAGRDFDPLVVEALRASLSARRAVTVLEWEPSMSVGVEELDNDHQVLIDLINQMAGADSRDDRLNVEAVLDELVDYTVFHFDREEKLMATAGYPDLEGHTRIHHSLCEQVLEIRRRIVDERWNGLGDEVLEFLGLWLRQHILRSDALYKPYLRRNADEESV